MESRKSTQKSEHNLRYMLLAQFSDRHQNVELFPYYRTLSNHTKTKNLAITAIVEKISKIWEYIFKTVFFCATFRAQPLLNPIVIGGVGNVPSPKMEGTATRKIDDFEFLTKFLKETTWIIQKMDNTKNCWMNAKKIIQKCFHLSISYFWIRFSGFFDVGVRCSSRRDLGGTIFFENLNVNLFWNRESPLKKVNITVGTNFWPNFRPDTKMRNFSLIIGHSRISQISLILKIQQKKLSDHIYLIPNG